MIALRIQGKVNHQDGILLHNPDQQQNPHKPIHVQFVPPQLQRQPQDQQADDWKEYVSDLAAAILDQILDAETGADG